MAKELMQFKNFARIKDTSLEINDITVLAGKPGLGKSYVMKMMYAIDEAFYRKSMDTLVDEFIKDEKRILMDTANIFLHSDKQLFSKAQELLKENKFSDFKNLLSEHFKDMGSLEIVLDASILGATNLNGLELKSKMVLFLSNIIKSIFSSYSQISDDFIVKTKNVEMSLVDGSLIFDFKDLLSLKNSPVVFVETPLILEFKKFMTREEDKTPYHLKSLLSVLDTDYSFTDENQDKFIKSFMKKSKEIIGGDLESSGDSFIFNKTDDKNYDIINASSGIKSIGLLQYLVTNKALKKGSVLFWEEPEVHLHPEWQLRMIELFVELMNAGVKVVFSTHSPYMCDYLNAMSQKNSFSDRVSFNLLTEGNDGVKNSILKTDDEWNKIQAELLDPLEEIMWEYL